MSHAIIDRRSTGTREATSQKRLHRRLHEHIKEAVARSASQGSIADAANGAHRIKVRSKVLDEPYFERDVQADGWERVLPGNQEFQKGDTLSKPDGSGAGGTQGAEEGLGSEEITIALSREEFLGLLFEGLTLPDLHRLSEGAMTETQWRPAGTVKDGMPSRLHVGQTMGRAKARRLALRNRQKKALEQLLAERDALQKIIQDRLISGLDTQVERHQLEACVAEIEVLERQRKAVPFIDNADLRFRHYSEEEIPHTQAVMILIMDVSGSMGDTEKDLARRFFMLLYLFLERQYATVELVFIKHHIAADECSEEAFFGVREGGGTLVSPALALARRIAIERYPTDRWNIYLAEASDGDNTYSDNARVREILLDWLPELRRFFYLEVGRLDPSDLWDLYRHIAEIQPRVVQKRCRHTEEVYPRFREMFQPAS